MCYAEKHSNRIARIEINSDKFSTVRPLIQLEENIVVCYTEAVEILVLYKTGFVSLATIPYEKRNQSCRL